MKSIITPGEAELHIDSYWSNFFWCTPSQLKQPWILVLPRLRGDTDDSEIYVCEWKDGATVIITPPSLQSHVQELIRIRTTESLETILRNSSSLPSIIFGPIITKYSLSRNALWKASSSVRKLLSSDENSYNDFLRACLPEDVNKVDMDFQNNFHRFFGYFHNEELQSVWNYQTDDEEDKLAHIWIITRPDSTGRGYAWEVVNALLQDIFDCGLLPQWRVHIDNIASNALADRFGFSETMRSYSIVFQDIPYVQY